MLIFSEDIVNEIVNKSRDSNNKECTITLNVSGVSYKELIKAMNKLKSMFDEVRVLMNYNGNIEDIKPNKPHLIPKDNEFVIYQITVWKTNDFYCL